MRWIISFVISIKIFVKFRIQFLGIFLCNSVIEEFIIFKFWNSEICIERIKILLWEEIIVIFLKLHYICFVKKFLLALIIAQSF